MLPAESRDVSGKEPIVINLKHFILALGLSVAGLVAVAPTDAFAHGGGFHGGGAGFHGGGGFHAAPIAFHGGGGFHGPGVAFHGAPVYRGGFGGGGYVRGGFAAPHVYGGYRGVIAPRVGVGIRPVGHVWVPGYWGYRGGARLWIAGSYMMPPTPGWVWIAPQWSWNGYQWVWQEGYWAPPSY